MSVVMTFFSPIAAPRNIDAVTPDDRPGIEREQRRLARARDRHRAAAALRDLQAVAIARARSARRSSLCEVARHHRPEVGVERGRGDALVLAPLGRDVDRAGDEHDPAPVRCTISSTRSSCAGFRNDHRKQIAIASHAFVEQLADRRFGFGLVQRRPRSRRSSRRAPRRRGSGAWARSATGFEVSGKCTTLRMSRPP